MNRRRSLLPEKFFAQTRRVAFVTASLLTAVPAGPIMAEERVGDSNTNEAAVRKARSVARLQQEGVPVNPHLPLLESESESTRRTPEQVVLRALALCVVSAKGEGVEQAIVDRLIDDFGVAEELTPDERAFVANPHPTQIERIQFSWRYECLWTLLWATGHTDTLARPDRPCDASEAVKIVMESGRDGLLRNARLRPQSEILDATDLTYRYHWAIVDARINGREAPAGLDGGVVKERHHALNWLIGYADQAWDEITTDT